MHTHSRILILAVASSLLALLSSCTEPNLGSENTYSHQVPKSAPNLQVQYGKAVSLTPGSLAQFPDFRISIESTTQVGADHLAKVAGEHYKYRVTDKQNQVLGHIILTPENLKTPRQFSINNKQFNILRNAGRYSITIQKPAHYLASNESVL
ncbi:hypothetical protein [Rubritalea marina]|uniref:hypothetical protein n=1 Tax=Rubritalea marina TaxID=361055 RepID=UPI00036B14BC|nr:hypothetical protein [Rubritalea marina]